MNRRSSGSTRQGTAVQGVCCAVALLLVPACGGANTSGAAVGRVGQDLSAHAQSVPQGTEVCALKEALAAQPGAAEKPLSEACSKPIQNDELWRRSIIVSGRTARTSTRSP